jgi:hypothetical protein
MTTGSWWRRQKSSSVGTDALEAAQLVLRVLLAAAFVVLGLSQRWWRIQKYLIEFAIPNAVVGEGDVETTTRRAVAIANSLLATSVVGGIALLAPWPLVNLIAGLILAGLVVVVGVMHFLESRTSWSEPAFRGELALAWGASSLAPVLIVLAVL